MLKLLLLLLWLSAIIYLHLRATSPEDPDNDSPETKTTAIFHRLLRLFVFLFGLLLLFTIFYDLIIYLSSLHLTYY